jgi:hypothetical protein
MPKPRTKLKEAGYHVLLWGAWKQFLRKRTRDADVAKFGELAGSVQLRYWYLLAVLAFEKPGSEAEQLLSKSCGRIAPELTAKALPVLRQRIADFHTSQRTHEARRRPGDEFADNPTADGWRASLGMFAVSEIRDPDRPKTPDAKKLRPEKLSAHARDAKRDALIAVREMAVLKLRPAASKSDKPQ